MNATDNQLKMLEIVFNHKAVQAMKPDEYNDYLQMILTLSLSTVRANKGSEFCKEFIEAGLNSQEDQVIVKQYTSH